MILGLMGELLKSSHHPALMDICVAKALQHPNGVAVNVLPTVLPRTDGNGIFQQGLDFSGEERQGNAAASITPIASPHIRTYVPLQTLLYEASQIFTYDPRIPDEMSEISLVSPQLLVWWRDVTALGLCEADEIALYKLGPDERRDYYDVIHKQVVKAVAIVEKISQKPTVWGSWGNGTAEERKIEGKSRGSPTNKLGHIQVTYFDKDSQELFIRNDIPASEKLNHFAPWNILIHREFHSAIVNLLATFVNRGDAAIEPFSEFIMRSNGASMENNGYTISFDQPVPFPEALNILVDTAGRFEELYEALNVHFADYYKNQSNVEAIEGVKKAVFCEFVQRGCTQDQSEKLLHFMFAIRPTYGQLVKWETELSHTEKREDDRAVLRHLRNRYERVHRRIEEHPGHDSLQVALLRDTLTPPKQFQTIERTWPVHATFFFMIDDYTLVDGTIMVSNMKLLPNIASTETAPEHKIGALLKRSLNERR